MANVMYAGEQRTIQVLVTKADGSGPLSLDGYKLTWMAKPQTFLPDSDPRTIVKTTTNGGIVIDPDQTANKGKALITLNPADTATISGAWAMGLRLFPGSVEVDQETLTIQDAVVDSIVAP